VVSEAPEEVEQTERTECVAGAKRQPQTTRPPLSLLAPRGGGVTSEGDQQDERRQADVPVGDSESDQGGMEDPLEGDLGDRLKRDPGPDRTR